MVVKLCKKIDNPWELLQKRQKPENVGSVLVFTGIVRGIGKDGGRVLKLHYEAHEELAEKVLRRIVEEAKEKYNLADVIVLHKVGEARVGEIVFFVAVLSKHREEGYKGLIEIVDRVKKEAPIWKKEYTTKGAYWV